MLVRFESDDFRVEGMELSGFGVLVEMLLEY